MAHVCIFMNFNIIVILAHILEDLIKATFGLNEHKF